MGLIKVIKTTLLVMAIGLICVRGVFASWSGPNVAVQGVWGTNSLNFGFSKGETQDSFPDRFYVLSDGRIAIDDGVNGKLKMYDKNGAFINDSDSLGFGLFELTPNNVIIAKRDKQLKKNKYSIGLYNLVQEQWFWIDQGRGFSYNPDMLVYISNDSNYFTVWTGMAGYKYSSTGVLLDAYTSKPLVFGQQVSSQKLPDDNYSTVIKFNDATYGCKTPSPFDIITRDITGFLYGESQVGESTGLHNRIYKISKCGKAIATLDFPPAKRHSETFTRRSQTYSIGVVDEEYGSPVIAPNGDVYTWKRTPDNYSILKWTWVGDSTVPSGPDAPTGLSVMPSTTGLYLSWIASPSDPGCVTGYEINRATSAGGVGSTITTVAAGTVKYSDTSATAGTTYYYKIRAVSGSEYSPYTIEVSGKR